MRNLDWPNEEQKNTSKYWEPSLFIGLRGRAILSIQFKKRIIISKVWTPTHKMSRKIFVIVIKTLWGSLGRVINWRILWRTMPFHIIRVLAEPGVLFSGFFEKTISDVKRWDMEEFVSKHYAIEAEALSIHIFLDHCSPLLLCFLKL